MRCMQHLRAGIEGRPFGTFPGTSTQAETSRARTRQVDIIISSRAGPCLQLPAAMSNECQASAGRGWQGACHADAELDEEQAALGWAARCCGRLKGIPRVAHCDTSALGVSPVVISFAWIHSSSNVGRPRSTIGRPARKASSAAVVARTSSQGYSVVPKHIDCSCPLPHTSTTSAASASPRAK